MEDIRELCQLVIPLFVAGELVLAYGALCCNLIRALGAFRNDKFVLSCLKTFLGLLMAFLAAAVAAGAISRRVYPEGDCTARYVACFDEATGLAMTTVADLRDNLQPFLKHSKALKSAHDDFLHAAASMNTNMHSLLPLSCSLKYAQLPTYLDPTQPTSGLEDLLGDEQLYTNLELLYKHSTNCSLSYQYFSGKAGELLGNAVGVLIEEVAEELKCRAKERADWCSQYGWVNEYETDSLRAVNETLYAAQDGATALLEGYRASSGKPCMTADITAVKESWTAAHEAKCLGGSGDESAACRKRRADVKNKVGAWTVWVLGGVR